MGEDLNREMYEDFWGPGHLVATLPVAIATVVAAVTTAVTGGECELLVTPFLPVQNCR